MFNQAMLRLGRNRSVIREIFEYSKQRAAVIGADKVFDFSIGNPSVPPPPQVITIPPISALRFFPTTTYRP